MSIRSAAAALLAFAAMPAHGAVTFASNLIVAGETQDLSGLTGTGNARLSFGSDLFYDKTTNLYYGITDRGPGGGVYDFAPRVSIFQLNVNTTTGVASGFTQVSTVVFKGPDGQPLTGLAPNLIPGGNSATLGRSFDSEGFTKLPNGNFLVSDEYGPSIYEFKPDGSYVRAFTQPANVLPKTNGTPDFSGTSLSTGRQDNRGYEGLTVSPDGKTAYAILQDPLTNEGAQNQGTRSQNLRIVQFDVATGQSTAQYIYQLESIASLNATLPSGATPYGATAQGRNIGVSSITALGNGKFLVIERDNRGYGITDPTASSITAAPGEKRVYIIDINGATDVSKLDLTGTSTLPAGTIPVSKSLFLDIQKALQQAGLPVPEKLEGPDARTASRQWRDHAGAGDRQRLFGNAGCLADAVRHLLVGHGVQARLRFRSHSAPPAPPACR